MCIVIICLPVCEVVDFKNKLSFIIKPFSYMTKKAEQKFKHLKNGKGFSHEIKSLFHYFERAFLAARNLDLRVGLLGRFPSWQKSFKLILSFY